VPGLRLFVQGLGKIDAQLIWQDAEYLKLPSSSRSSFEESLKLTDRIALSQLWLLGAYEATRTLAERLGKAPKIGSKRLRTRVTTMKRKLARVRMPLAKLAPGSAHKATDFSQAVPALHQELGISWKVAKHMIVPRQKLSTALLKVLKECKLWGAI
jgi:uncharacterized protein YneF (UPF0154 family)